MSPSRLAHSLLLGLLILGSGWLGAAQKPGRNPAEKLDVAIGGAACVMAKWQGDTLDYALVYGKQHPIEAVEEAERILASKGYDRNYKNVDIRHTQATALYPHGYVMVVKSVYKNWRGKEKTGYGCGFSMRSFTEARGRALNNLQSYSWGWMPSMGFEIVEQLRYP
jgi:hypothetical protein